MSEDREQKARLYALVLGKLIAHYRRQGSWSQERLAAAVGITQPTLSRIERGVSQPDFFTMREFERVFGLDPGELAILAEKALEQARRAAMPGVEARSPEGGAPWWGIALGIAGFAGLVGFAVAALLEDDDDEYD